MTEEKFKKVIEINNRLKSLGLVKEKIKDKSIHRLSYTRKFSEDDYAPVHERIMMNISELLDKHDNMIRAEIDEEIEKLKKEINEL